MNVRSLGIVVAFELRRLLSGPRGVLVGLAMLVCFVPLSYGLRSAVEELTRLRSDAVGVPPLGPIYELIGKIQRTISLADRQPLYFRFHRLLHEELPYTFLFFNRSIVVYDTRMRGVKFYGTGLRPCYDRREWWIPSEQRMQ